MAESPLPRPLRWMGPLLAAGYGIGMRLHRAVTISMPAPIATICVGNLTVGGTGKTPAVKYFARELAKRGRKPAVLMRGYKAQGSDEAKEMEAALGDLKIPILIASDRHASTIRARDDGRDVALLDDGFQHWRLKRDLDIVLVDATDPFSENRLLPHGRLRERAAGLSRAGVVIVTRADAVDESSAAATIAQIRHLAPGAVVARARHRPARLVRIDGAAEEPVSALSGQGIYAACGIGNPDAFRRTLLDLGVDLRGFLPFSDHHAYTNADAAKLREHAELADVGKTVVTEKDAVKLRSFEAARDLWMLEIRFDIVEGESAVWARIGAALSEAEARLALD